MCLPAACRNEIGRRVGCELPGTLVYDYPTSAAITAYLVDRLVPLVQDGSAPKAAELGAGMAVGQVTTPGQELGPAVSALQQVVVVTEIRSRTPQLHVGLPALSVDPIQPVPYDRWDTDFNQVLSVFGRATAYSRTAVAAVRFGG